jgi:predicted nucleotidyltransferase
MNALIELIETKRGELAELCRRYRVERLYLFGSAATDRFVPASSDLDFVVEMADRQPTGSYADRYFGLLEALERLFGRPVDLVVESAIRNPYFREAVEKTKTLLYAA